MKRPLCRGWTGWGSRTALSLRIRLFPKRRHEDPPEPWEYALSREVAVYLCRRTRFEHPFVPHRERIVPKGAFEELRKWCGVRSLQDLFVVPENVRGTGDGKTILRTPTQVLGFGREAVGIWVEHYDPPVPIVLPIEHIAAIVDLNQLLYGRLCLSSAAQVLTLRYNTVSHRALRWQLLRLRRLLWRRYADRTMSVEGDEPSISLPRKWRLVVNSNAVRLTREAPAAIHTENMWQLRSGPLPRRIFKPNPPGAELAAVTPAELVVGTEPPDFNGQYGLRLMHIPRSHIERVGLGETPTVDTRGLELPLPVAPRLAVRIGQTLARSGQDNVVDR